MRPPWAIDPRPVRLSANAGLIVLHFPATIPLGALGFVTAGLFYFDGRRPAPGKCRCGYDLTGNTSGVCPECGQDVATAATEVHP